MVTVPVYGGRQVTARPDLQQGININASASAFGGDVGQGMEQIGRGMGQAANAMIGLRQIEDTMRAKDALTGFERAKMQLDYGANGYFTTQGRNSVDLRGKYDTDLEELKRKYGAGLTPGAARAYDDAATVAVTSGMKASIMHSAQGQKDWALTASTARLDTLTDQALLGYSKPGDVGKSIAAGFMEIDAQAQLMGWGKDVVDLKRREFATGVHAKVALALASEPNGASRAMTYLSENSGTMDAKTRMDIEARLKPFANDEAALSVVNDIMGQTRRPSTPAGALGGAGPTTPRARLIERAKAAGKGADHVDGLDAAFATNLEAMFEDAPPGIREGLQVGSGFRSVDRQQQLWDDAVRKYGSAEAARKWVAPPGGSQHNAGKAVDIWYNGARLDQAPPEVRDWVHANADKYGLRLPMSWESWHIEPAGARGGGVGSTVVASRDGVSVRADMPSYDAAMSRIMEIQDPEVRASAMKQLNAQFDMRGKAEAAAAADAKSQIWAMVAQGAPMSQVPLNLKIAAGREAVQGFEDYSNKAAEINTDPVLQRDLTLFAATNPKDFAKIDLTAPEIINQLSRPDLKALIDKQASVLGDERKASEEGLNISSAMTYARTQLDAVGISTTNLKDDARRQMAETEARFQMALAQEMESFRKANNGTQPTQADIIKMTNRLLLPTVIKTTSPGIFGSTKTTETTGFLFDTEGKLGKIADGSSAELNYQISQIPPAERVLIEAALRSNLKREPSDAEIIAYYENYQAAVNNVDRGN